MIDVLGPEKRRRRTTQEKIAIIKNLAAATSRRYSARRTGEAFAQP